MAGAAILAGAGFQAAQAGTQATGTDGSGNDEVALAQPRITLHGSGGVALPQPLAPSEATRIRRIFALQARGDLREAAAETGRLDNKLLLGAILADRYLRQPRQAGIAELKDWLRQYTDQPDAPAIRALLIRRLPKNAPPPPPVAASAAAAVADTLDPAALDEADPASRALQRNALLDRTVHTRADSGHADSALHLIAITKGMTAAYGARLRAEVARSLFSRKQDAKALDVAAAAFKEAGDQVGLAGYMAGLAAWRLQRFAEARPYFEAASRATLASPALRAAAAFWAARAHLRTGDPGGYMPWMRQAANEQRSFYGLLARRILGLGVGFASDNETLGEADVEAIGATDQGKRAFALLQVGQLDRAQAEFRALWPTAGQNPALARSLLLVSSKAGLTDLASQIATALEATDGRPRDDARFPLPHLAPRGGFRMSRALVYALTRLESNFDPKAVSAAGARGLMQIMPVTASYLAGEKKSAGSFVRRLHDPAVNLQIGQNYVLYLADHPTVDGDLIRLLASYNAGPGNVGKWIDAIGSGGDPLLFIESIPFDETRQFVERALTYTWIYAARLDVPAPSLDELAAGAWPRFDPKPEETRPTEQKTAHLEQVSVRLH